MHDKRSGASDDDRAETPALQDLRDRSVVLIHVLTLYPMHLRLSELIQDISAGAADFSERDGIERAVRDLIGTGLLFRSDGWCCRRGRRCSSTKSSERGYSDPI